MNMETNLGNCSQVYKTYSDADKIALKELREETQARMPDVKVTLNDMIAAVTPGLETPAHLR
jgi:hypothetical protein